MAILALLFAVTTWENVHPLEFMACAGAWKWVWIRSSLFKEAEYTFIKASIISPTMNLLLNNQVINFDPLEEICGRGNPSPTIPAPINVCFFFFLAVLGCWMANHEQMLHLCAGKDQPSWKVSPSVLRLKAEEGRCGWWARGDTETQDKRIRTRPVLHRPQASVPPLLCLYQNFYPNFLCV